MWALCTPKIWLYMEQYLLFSVRKFPLINSEMGRARGQQRETPVCILLASQSYKKTPFSCFLEHVISLQPWRRLSMFDTLGAVVDSVWQKLFFLGKYGHRNVPCSWKKHLKRIHTSSENMSIPSCPTINTNIEPFHEIWKENKLDSVGSTTPCIKQTEHHKMGAIRSHAKIKRNSFYGLHSGLHAQRRMTIKTRTARPSIQPVDFNQLTFTLALHQVDYDHWFSMILEYIIADSANESGVFWAVSTAHRASGATSCVGPSTSWAQAIASRGMG